MADNEEGEETSSQGNEWEVSRAAENDDEREVAPRGNDWEVVSLTASAYAAAPGPRGDESIYETSTAHGSDEAETSRALFMSGHFLFPPSEHENLPIAPEIDSTTGAEENVLVSNMDLQKESKSAEILEGCEEYPGVPFFDVKGQKMLSSDVTGFNEPTAIHGSSVGDKEQDFYGAGKLSSFHSDTLIDGSAAFEESTVMNDLVDVSDKEIDSSFAVSEVSNSVKEEDDDDSMLPCGAWWKRRVASLCAHAKETSTIWSIFVAAAVMGLVVLGQRWQQERWQVLHQRWLASINDEKPGKMLAGLKDVVVGGSRRGTYTSFASTEH